MSLVDSLSHVSTKSELDFFTVPPTQVVIKKGWWEEIYPVNPITSKGPYDFRIPADPNYIQLSKNYVYMQLRIKTPTVAADNVLPNVGPINLIGKTFFRQVKLFLNSNLVYDSGDKYSYRAFFETELNYGNDAKTSHLQSSLYSIENGESEDDLGFQERSSHFKNGAIVEVTAPLHVDLFMQDRYLVNFTDMRLELHRNDNNFVLLCPKGMHDVELEVVQMKLFLRKVEILDSVSLAINKISNTTSFKYPIRRVVMTNLNIASSAQSSPLNTLFTGQLPRRMIIACVDADAYRGNIKKSPFKFNSYSISEIKVICGGQTFPHQPLRLDFSKNIYVRAYDMLFEALDLARDNRGNCISRDDYKLNKCFFAFDLTPDEDDSGHWDLIREGSTSVEITFSEKLPSTGIEVIIYSEFDNLLMIDKNRSIFHDFTA